jgi:hypothetical protein
MGKASHVRIVFHKLTISRDSYTDFLGLLGSIWLDASSFPSAWQRVIVEWHRPAPTGDRSAPETILDALRHGCCNARYALRRQARHERGFFRNLPPPWKR